MSSNFNFVFCCNAKGYYDYGYRDLLKLSNVVYHTSRLDGFTTLFSRLLLRINFSKKVNKLIPEPFAFFVNKRLYAHSFPVDSHICYVFFGHTEFAFQSSFINYIKQKYINVKIVLYMHDLVARNPNLIFDVCLKRFDLMLSYDKGDCIKYKMLYYPTPMSSCLPKHITKDVDCDFYFCGIAKTRYTLLYDIYDKATNLGYKCDFFLFDLPQSAKKKKGIHYLDKYMSYEDNIKRITRCKCLIEIMQDSADGYTPRLWESIVCEKHLLTNNKAVFDSEYYCADYIHGISSFLEDSESKDWICTSVHYSSSYKKLLSPVNLLDFIEEKLNSHI